VREQKAFFGFVGGFFVRGDGFYGVSAPHTFSGARPRNIRRQRGEDY
jgi:hypothetical protein